MKLKSKIIFFLIPILVMVSLISCKKSKYDVIPYTPVDFWIDLNFADFSILTAGPSFKVITSETIDWGIRLAGWDNNGITVYRSAMDEFHAYDRTCPHDYAVNGLSIKIKEDFMSATCPQCGTVYSLEIGGTPISGIGKYPLKNYRTSFYENRVHVYN
jgi:nitrite reductase/ring-hydroxylating ferredoxin subunit